jgi:hypothetical protein
MKRTRRSGVESFIQGGVIMSDRRELLTPLPPPLEDLRNSAFRIRAPNSAERLWNRHLTPGDRERLGDDFDAAYHRLGTAGMWAKLRGVTPQRAVVEVAYQLGFLREEDQQWLLREIGEEPDVEIALSQAIDAGDFVLVESPRGAYWTGEEIAIDWSRHSAMWEFLWQVGRHGKAGRPIDSFTFGESASPDIVTKRKFRLTNMRGFPVDLGDAIESVGSGTQQLILPRERIRIFTLSGLETLEEWHP